MTEDDIATVEAATRQWFRLAAGHPRAKLSMPSVVADDLWHELVLHTQDYAVFCEAALGRFLHHVPESAMSPAGAAANRRTGLLTTFQLAQRDEGCDATQLPLLFRVDEELAIDGGRHFLADCGGRGECYEIRGRVCLQHLLGVGNSPRRGWGQPPDSGMSGPFGAGGGCGGGDGG